MNPVLSLFSILAALTLGAISPGPSFLFVTRTSVALSRRDGLAAALGMGLGAAFFCALALIGLRAVIAQVEWVYIGFKLLGGAYLLYSGLAPVARRRARRRPRSRCRSVPARSGLARSFCWRSPRS